MQRRLNWMLGTSLVLVTFAAAAEFHTFQIEEIFSDKSGAVQYVVMHEALHMDGETLWSGHALTATRAGVTNTFVFTHDLPGPMCDYYCGLGPTANKRVLIATEGFAALGILTPDYVMPNGFIPTAGGTLNYAGVDQVSFGALPTDGVTAMNRNGAMQANVATNLAGQSASVTAAAPTVDLNQHGLTGSWYEAATGGQGIEIEVFPDPSSGTGSTFVSWFTYDTVAGGAERQRWYTAQGQMVTGQSGASLKIYQNAGGNFNAPPVTTAQEVGTAMLSFDSCSSGQFAYTFNDGTGRTGSIPLTRLTLNVTCATTAPYPTNADFALSGNWFGGAATSGQGFTVDVNPNSSALFAAWYTYMPSGTTAGAAGQRWYTAQGTFTPGMRSIPVILYETTGGVFDTPTPPGQKTVPVGTGKMTFQSCVAATFDYTFASGSSAGMSGTILLSRVGPVPPGCTS